MVERKQKEKKRRRSKRCVLGEVKEEMKGVHRDTGGEQNKERQRSEMRGKE